MASNLGYDTENNEQQRATRREAPSIQVNDIEVDARGQRRDKEGTEQKTDYEDEARRLRKLLRLYFYAAFKWKGNTCYFHLIYCFFFCIQIIKVALLTTQMFQFGNDRGNFSSVVNRGHLTLRHLLLEHWDASWETLPYPPAQGDFAVYTISDLESGINFSVQNYYNAEKDAIGYYIRTPDDKMIATVKYFDFPGFNDAHIEEGILISDKTFPIDKGLTSETTPENETLYSYNITREFEYLNLSQPIKRMLSTTLHLTLHSVRSHINNKKATCLKIEGWVEFVDLDNNGQVSVDLDTHTRRIKCRDMNLSLSDWQLENTSETAGAAVIVFTIFSIIITTLTIAFAAFSFWKTKHFMKKHYRSYYGAIDEDEIDLPTSEYLRFVKFWDITVLFSDVLTLYGTIWIVFNTEHSEWVLEILDSYTVWLGVGCILAWLSLLRFFKFHNKFHLLFSTLYRAFWDVLAYLICVGVLFVAFWVCGYVVMAPYHVKFQTPAAAAETLFAIVNGDEIYATLAILESDKSGGNWVWWFSRFYFGAYVAIFTIVVINLLIALYNSAYDSIKSYYKDKPNERELGPMEKALRRFLEQKTEGTNLRSSICDLMSEGRSLSKEESSLRMELEKIVQVSKSKNDVVLLKPRTLKAFMEDEDGKTKEIKCCCMTCSFTLFSGHDQASSGQ
ncbi:mucolipin-3-like isoform X2 [Mercenaria mercenaria]|uniref:mucolipin-3-like isoform X2 n=1 Tax=Mercenaria mercenaria TaxID=6596 RepID=UPI00234F3EB3|nr:mucolipin-3-like isoform X2 [Mercenaria mercenaria]